MSYTLLLFAMCGPLVSAGDKKKPNILSEQDSRFVPGNPKVFSFGHLGDACDIEYMGNSFVNRVSKKALIDRIVIRKGTPLSDLRNAKA